ncbi:MAG: site-specific DNA-methyltransferase [Microthrixaceae bacterium]
MLAESLADAAASARARHVAGLWPELVFLDIEKERVQRKKHLADDGRVPETLWLAPDVGGSLRGKNEVRELFPDSHAFATPKPEQLLQRILHIATDPGDIVLDCFAGSGTSAAVAHKMGRQWVAVERERSTVDTFTKPRLTKVLSGEDPGGITTVTRPTGDGLPVGLKSGEARTAAKALKAMFEDGNLDHTGLDEPTMKAVAKAMRGAEKTETETLWPGGGGFRHLRVGPSMFDLDAESGDVFLAEWATNGAFSEAVAAQLGFERREEPPFCGVKGRTRLAVLDGVVGATEVEYLTAALDEGERMVLVGQAFTDDAAATLREQSPGSKVRHAPYDLLRGGRQR